VSRLSPVAGGRAHADVIALAEQIPLEELPEFVGALAQAQSLATLRLMGQGSQANPPASASLLTAEEVATALRISEANVYARAKTDLKAAAVDVGPGQLRFDRDSIGRFINARRRG
jgi:Helix-turn-helix domain